MQTSSTKQAPKNMAKLEAPSQPKINVIDVAEEKTPVCKNGRAKKVLPTPPSADNKRTVRK